MSRRLSSAQSKLGKLWAATAKGFDKTFPPKKRDELLSKVQDFAAKKPKLASFLASHLVLTGIPLLLFIAFAIVVLVFSLVTALLFSLLAAVVFTLFMVGVALFFLVPALLVTTFLASTLFLWVLGGFHILKWSNQRKSSNSKSAGGQTERHIGGHETMSGSEHEASHSGHGGDGQNDSDNHRETMEGKGPGSGLEKVTEHLKDDAHRQSNDPPIKILRLVNVEEATSDTEKSTGSAVMLNADEAAEA